MKRLTVCLIVGALALAGVFILNRRPVASPSPGLESKNPPPATAASALPTATPAPAASIATISPDAGKTFAAFENFSQWAKAFTNGAVTIMDGQRLAWKRHEAMLELIQTDPQRAIELSVPFELRQRLPPPVTKFFEEQVDGRGDLEVLAATDFSTGSTATFRNVQLGDRRFQAFVYGRRNGQVSQGNIPLHGVTLDGKLAVATSSLRELSLAEATALDKKVVAANAICSVSGRAATSRGQQIFAEGGGGVLHFCGVDHFNLADRQLARAESGGTSAGTFPVYPSAAQDSWTHGNKFVLYIRVNFPDDLTEPISETAAYAAMNGVNSFYTENSYDLTSLTTTVTPVITMPQTKAYYSPNPGLLQADARAWAKKAGYVTANYDRDIISFTSVPGYNFGGLASVGGKGVWLQSFSVGVTAHELGHNYGLLHANFWDTRTNFSMVGPGTNLEYGNIYDTMGPAAAGNALFNAVHKNILDWLKADAVQTITSNGIYRLYPFDVPAGKRVAGRNYAAAVKRDSLRDCWLEFRTKYTANAWAENGLLLNWTPWDESNGGAHLIDTTPGSPDAGDSASRSDAAVTIGRTFNDPAAGLHLTPLQRVASGAEPWIDYQVNLGAFPSNQPPVLAVEADLTNAAPGALVHFHATATDPDGDALAYAWTFDDLTFSTNNLPWISKTFSGSGDHLVRCVVSDMKGGEASANFVVNTGPSAGFTLSGRVTDTNGEPVAGVLVGNGQIAAAKFIGGWTDSDGRYTLVNVSGATNFNLNALSFGYTYTAAANWSNPLRPTNSLADLDFIATPLPFVNVFADTNSVVESDGSAHTFTVTRTGDTNNDLAVNFALTGSATPGLDYTVATELAGTNNILTIPAGTNSVTFTFHVINDSLVEAAETISLTLLDDDQNTSSPNYALAPLADATVTILDDDSGASASVTVATTTPQISENGMDPGQIIFTRTGGAAGDLAVNYSLTGTATAGADYTALPGVAVIAAGQSSVTIPLLPVDDKNFETNETVIVTATAGAGYTVGSPAGATITILDDDAMMVTVAATGNAAEPSTAGQFTVKRDGDLTAALVVNYNVSGSASNGVDFAALAGTVTIPAGAASANISVAPIDDALLEGDETVILALTNTVNYDVGTPGSATIFLHDKERPTVSITATGSPLSEQGNTNAQFTITRDRSVGDLTVFLNLSGTATPGADYVPLDNPVVIPDGATSVSLDLIPFHDLILEPTETVILTLPTNANYFVASSASATVEILDDGTSAIPGLGFCFITSAFLESESPGIAVTLSQTSSVPVQVSYRVLGGTAPGSRYSLPAGTLIIPANTWVGFVPLKITNDAIVELPQTIRVVLFNPTNATLDGIKIHTYTILDDDACSVSVAATTNSAAETGLISGNFRITRVGSTNSAQPVNFQITGTASAPTDYAPLGNSTVIPAGATFVDLPVTPVDDGSMEFPQTVVLTLTSATNANIISPNVATVTISDNDTNNLPVVTVTSTNRPYALEGGGNGEFLFTRTGPLTNGLIISFVVAGTASNGTDYATITNSVTILAGQSNAIVTVAAVDDPLIEGDETVIISLTLGTNYRTAYPASATVTIQDNDQRVWLDASDFVASKYHLDPGQFTFSRFGTTNLPVTIPYVVSGTASNGFDYVRITNVIVIPAGQVSVTLPILPQHTGIPKGPATATLTLLTNAAFVLGTPTNGTVTIDDDMPMVTISGSVTNVLEGSVTNGVFRLTRTGDPQYDFTAYLSAGGTAVYNVDYAAFPTAVYFSCGVIAIDLPFATFNNSLADGNQTVTATLVPNPAYTILSPSNALVNIAEAGPHPTPTVHITKPSAKIIFLNETNRGLVLQATVTGSISNSLAWTEENSLNTERFDTTNTTDTAVLFTNAGVYRLRLTAEDSGLSSYDEITVVVGAATLIPDAVLRWPFDEGSGTNVLDASTLGHDGVLVGNPQWVTNGVLRGALNFGGTNDYVRQSAGGNVLDGHNVFSLSLWIRSTTTNLDQGIFTASTAAGDTLAIASRTHASCGNTTNVFEITLATTKGVVHRTSANNAAVAGKWQNLILTWSNGVAPALYINGRLDQPTYQWETLKGKLTNCLDFVVAKGPASSPATWTGLMDDVRLFPKMLTANQALSLGGPGLALSFNSSNAAPQVDAGTNFTVQIGVPLQLTGTSSDDGLPNPPATLVNYWQQVYTNTITIPNTNSLVNTLVITNEGDYTFRLTADDSDIAVFAEVTVAVILPPRVDITADIPEAYELGPVNGSFTITRTGGTNADLIVYLAISGTASNSVDYLALTNIVTLSGGSNSLTLPVTPILDYAIEGDEAVTLTILTNVNYVIGNAQSTVTVHDSPYGVWSLQHFTIEQLTHPLISGPAADFEFDGVNNFSEYAFNHDPQIADGNPPYQWSFETSTNDNQPHLTLTWTRRLPPRDVEYGVFISTNLVLWNTGTNGLQEFLHTNDPNGITETVKTRALQPFTPAATNRLFMNLRVWLQQVPAP